MLRVDDVALDQGGHRARRRPAVAERRRDQRRQRLVPAAGARRRTRTAGGTSAPCARATPCSCPAAASRSGSPRWPATVLVRPDVRGAQGPRVHMLFRPADLEAGSPRARSRSPSGAGRQPRVKAGSTLRDAGRGARGDGGRVVDGDLGRGRAGGGLRDAGGDRRGARSRAGRSTGRAAPRRARTRGSRCARRRPTTRSSRTPRADGRRGPTSTCRRSPTSPGVRAADLAGVVRPRDALDFKRDVRRLKELGLTESLEIGYRLSPRGKGSDGDVQLAAERPPEQVALALGGPARDRDVLVGVQAQLDACRSRPATSRRVHGLVARALELLGEPHGGARSGPAAPRRRRARAARTRPSAGRALAVVARGLADQRGLARREARQARR